MTDRSILRNKSTMASHRYAACLCLMLSGAGCMATSRLPFAVVLSKDDAPCFTVNKSFQQATVLRLFSLQVTEDSSPSWRVLPKTMWSFEALPIGSSIDWNPLECIAYGDAPHGVHVENKSLPLKTYKIYHLSLTARSHNGDDDVLSHTARFCLINDSRGHTVATPIPWDESGGRWQNEVCTPPDQKILEKRIQQ